LLLVAFLLVNAPNCHLALASVVQGDAVNFNNIDFATRYGYPNTAFKREPDTDPDIRNALSMFQGFRLLEKVAQSFIHYLQMHHFSLLCHNSESVYGVISEL